MFSFLLIILEKKNVCGDWLLIDNSLGFFGGFLVIEDGSGRNVLVALFAGFFRWWWWWGLAVFGRWDDATQDPSVEHQRGRATLETRVTSLTGPVTVA